MTSRPSTVSKPAKQTLLSVGILVDANAGESELEAIGKALRAAADQAAAASGSEASGVVCYDYLGAEGTNALRCSACGQWASDTDKPDRVGCIALGHWINGSFFCTQCRLPLRT